MLYQAFRNETTRQWRMITDSPHIEDWIISPDIEVRDMLSMSS